MQHKSGARTQQVVVSFFKIANERSSDWHMNTGARTYDAYPCSPIRLTRLLLSVLRRCIQLHFAFHVYTKGKTPEAFSIGARNLVNLRAACLSGRSGGVRARINRTFYDVCTSIGRQDAKPPIFAAY